MNRLFVPWVPTALLAFGALFTLGIDPQRPLPLRQPLAAAVPLEIAGYQGHALTMSPDEQGAVGVSAYLLRGYQALANQRGLRTPRGPGFNLYVGYYERQLRGTTIHSPKNCLPGAGWEALTSQTERILTPAGPVLVNRYLLERGSDRVLVLYWYQGRGRVASNEYRVKWELLRDAALRHRSDEALVRVVVPLTRGEGDALATAAQVASELIPNLYTALPS